VAANDRTGLLYSIANVLAKYRINLHTAKVMTLGERVEDVFLIDGAALNNAQPDPARNRPAGRHQGLTRFKEFQCPKNYSACPNACPNWACARAAKPTNG
jgi:hypothetical protein